MKQELEPLLTVQSEERQSALLMPGQYRQLVERGGLDPIDVVVMNFLIATGVRFREMQYLAFHPEAFIPERRVLIVPETKLKRKKQTLSRYVKLSTWGIKSAVEFFQAMDTLPAEKHIIKESTVTDEEARAKGEKKRLKHDNEITYKWHYDRMADYYIKKWARKAGLDPTYLDIKSTRKTCIAWLIASHPNREGDIAMSIGHSIMVDLKNYRATPFTEEDVEEARAFMQHWGNEDI